jgi:transposase
MDASLPIVPTATLPTLSVRNGGAGATPFSQIPVVISKAEYIELHHQARYWKAQHLRATREIARLQQDLQCQAAQIKDLQARLFDKKSEKGHPAKSEADPARASGCTRGQQRNAPGHGRTPCPSLPVREESLDVAVNAQSCPKCALPLKRCEALDEVSEIKEIEVQAYIRRAHRRSYLRSCQCPETPVIVTAPPPIRLLPRSPYGISFWVQVILAKYYYGQPTHRQLQDLRDQGLPVSPGTVAGGLQAIAPLFEPLSEAFYCRQMSEPLFHGDETRWEVFVALEGKVGSRWYLWVFRSASVIFYSLDPSRSAAIPGAHFAGLQGERAILVCDRYSAYKKLARLSDSILLAFCWAHVRRDFLEAGRSMTELEDWALDWKERIGSLYHLNGLRLDEWQPDRPLAQQSAAFQAHHQALATTLEGIEAEAAQLTAPEPKRLMPPEATALSRGARQKQRTIAQSLLDHWDGLRLFLDHPEVPMDNNLAENAIRGPVTGRKNYYGSGSLWSAALAATLFTLFQTLALWGIPVRRWLNDYLQACAHNGGRPPEDITPFLPWSLAEVPRSAPSRPPAVVVKPPDTS